jgi:hypothetical protein
MLAQNEAGYHQLPVMQLHLQLCAVCKMFLHKADVGATCFFRSQESLKVLSALVGSDYRS